MDGEIEGADKKRHYEQDLRGSRGQGIDHEWMQGLFESREVEQRRKGGADIKKCFTGLSVRIASSYKRQKRDYCGFGSRDLCDRAVQSKDDRQH